MLIDIIRIHVFVLKSSDIEKKNKKKEKESFQSEDSSLGPWEVPSQIRAKS